MQRPEPGIGPSTGSFEVVPVPEPTAHANCLSPQSFPDVVSPVRGVDSADSIDADSHSDPRLGVAPVSSSFVAPGPILDPDNNIDEDPEERDMHERIGHVFVMGQRFVDDATEKAQGEATAIVADARARAQQFLDEARAQASHIVQESQRPGQEAPRFAPETVQQLQTTIDAFARVNAELVQELARLSATLRPIVPAPELPSVVHEPGAPADSTPGGAESPPPQVSSVSVIPPGLPAVGDVNGSRPGTSVKSRRWERSRRRH